MDAPKVRDYMTRTPLCVDGVATLDQALEQMRENGIRHLPVMDGVRLVGLLSERDAHLPKLLEGSWADRITVEEVMAKEPYRVTPEDSIERVAIEMARRKFGSAVVMEDRRVVGVFTTTDALRALVDQLARLRGAPAPEAAAPVEVGSASRRH